MMADAASMESLTGSLVNLIIIRQPDASHRRMSAGARLRISLHSYLFIVILYYWVPSITMSARETLSL